MPLSMASAKLHRPYSNRTFQESSIVGSINTNLEPHYDLVSTPSSVHSMLRNTTETGDIGIFSIKPPRTPDPTEPALETSPNHFLYHELDIPKHQIDQLHDHQSPLLRQWQGDKGRLASLRSHKGVDSSVVSRHQSKSQQSNRFQRDIIKVNIQDSSYSHSNTGLRPQSPFAHPTRLKRPGHRPFSPALTDCNSSDARTRFGLDRGTGTRTASPLSLYTTKRSPLGYKYDLNQFDPSALSTKDNIDTSRPPSGLRQTPIPRLSSKQNFESFTYDGHQYRSYGDGWRHRRSRFLTPLFYDYTEAFEEEKKYYSADISLTPLTEPPVPQLQPSALLREPEGNTDASQMVELPDRTAISLKLSKSLPQIVEKESSSTSVEKNSITYTPTWMDDIAKEDVEPTCRNTTLKPKPNGHDLPDKMEPTETEISYRKAGDTFEHHLLFSSNSKDRDLLSLNANPAVNNTLALPHDSRSSTSLSNNSSDLFPPCEIKTLTPPDTGDTSPSWKTALLPLGHPGLLASKDNELNLQNSWFQSNECTEAGRVALHAPVAEHPISSPRRRERFSRIFSIDESFDEMDRCVTKSDIARLGTLSNQTYDGDPVIRKQSQLPPHLEGLPHGDCATNLWMHNSEHASVFDTNQTDLDISALSSTESEIGSATCSLSTSSQVVDSRSPLEENEAQLSTSPGAVTAAGSSPFSFMPITDNVGTASRLESTGFEDTMKPSALSRSLKLKGENVIPRYKLKMRSGRLSATSLPGSRSQNLETDYPQAGPHDGTDISIHYSSFPIHQETTLKIPKFKLKVTRASDSSNGTMKIRKEAIAFQLSSKWRLATPSELFRPGQFGRKGKVDDAPNGGSKIELIPVRTRFTEELESRPSSAPHTTSPPQSPGLRFAEVQSFFSDDSSQLRQKTSLRQRLSQFKAIASRASSSDDPRNLDRRNTGSALGRSRTSERTSGRVSAQTGQSTVGMSHLQYTKWKLREKVKGWWHRGEHKVRGWGGRVRKVSSRGRLRSPELSRGV